MCMPRAAFTDDPFKDKHEGINNEFNIPLNYFILFFYKKYSTRLYKREVEKIEL